MNINNQKGFANIVLVVVIVVILVGAVGYFAFVKKSEPIAQQPTPTSTQTKTPVSPTPIPKDETANWKTYTNAQYGFEFRYPNAWISNPGMTSTDGRITSVINFVNRRFSIPEQNDVLFDVIIWDVAKDIEFHKKLGGQNITTFNDWFEQYYKNIESDNAAIKVDNIEIIPNTISQKNSYLETYQQHIKIGHVRDLIYKDLVIDLGDNKALIIEAYSLLSNKTEFSLTYNQILSTLKFTK